MLRNSSLHRSPYSPVSYIFKVFLKPAKTGAQSLVFASVCKDLENVNGKYFKEFNLEKPSENAFNKEDAQRLWLTAEKWTRLK